jgi:hypothetical protein
MPNENMKSKAEKFEYFSSAQITNPAKLNQFAQRVFSILRIPEVLHSSLDD